MSQEPLIELSDRARALLAEAQSGEIPEDWMDRAVKILEEYHAVLNPRPRNAAADAFFEGGFGDKA